MHTMIFRGHRSQKLAQMRVDGMNTMGRILDSVSEEKMSYNLALYLGKQRACCMPCYLISESQHPFDTAIDVYSCRPF